jgi:Methyltransferase FkbM domain
MPAIAPITDVVVRNSKMNMKRILLSAGRKVFSPPKRTALRHLLSTICSRWIQHRQGRYCFPYTDEELSAFKFSFSECGEDLAVIKLVRELGLAPGIYVDAGAFHPVCGSNTLLLHKCGWRGINIDLEEAKIAEFRKFRPSDYNVVACLSDAMHELQVAHYDLNILDRVVTGHDQSHLSLTGTEPESLVKMRTTTLTRVIEQSPFSLEQISYLNIDCEGHDFMVLRGLDLSRCRPQILSIEMFTEEERRTIGNFLAPYGYRFDQFLKKTAIFVRTP